MGHDPGYVHDLYNYRIFLDGYKFLSRDLVTADEKGFIEVYRRDLRKQLINAPDSNNVDTEIIYGVVEIKRIVTEQQVIV